MSTSVRVARLLLGGVLVLLASSANAFDFDGAWATDAAKCAQIFTKKKNKISMTKHSEFFGGGFIVEGSRVRGPAAACKISDRKEEGDMLHLIASCTTQIAILSPTQLDIKIEDDNKIIRFFANFSELAVSYTRCAL
jgi:hypothetical protein